MSTVFQKASRTAHQVYNSIQYLVKNYMKPPDNVRRTLRLDKEAHRHILATTSVTWTRTSQAQARDWWAICGAAYLEAHLVALYCPPLLLMELGHARRMLEEILNEFVQGSFVTLPGSKRTVFVKKWLWVDGLETPAELPPLEDILAIDAERIYQLEQVRIQNRKACEGLINFVWGMDAAKTSVTRIIDVSKLKGKAKAAADTGPMTEEIQFLERDVFKALLALTQVCFFNLLLTISHSLSLIS